MRIFIALTLSCNFNDKIMREVIGVLRDYKKKVRFIEQEKLHLTLKFFGEISRNSLECLKQNFQNQDWEFQALTIKGFNFFSDNIIRLNVSPINYLSELKFRVENFSSLAGFRKDRRPFIPHFTIGRVKHPFSPEQKDAILKIPIIFEQVLPQSIIIFESHLKPNGVSYTPMSKYCFTESKYY